MCVSTTDRYTAGAALKDPFILGDDWTEAHVDSLLAELDDCSIYAVPSAYTEEEWLKAVAAIAQEPDESSRDDEEDGF